VTRATKRLRRGSVASIAALATVGGALMAIAGTAGATSTATATRIAGSDRYDTAAKAAETAFPSGASTVILASGLAAHFPDALAGNYLAGQLGAPILLTTGTGTIPAKTTAALSTLKATTVYVLGDEKAVSADQANQLTTAGYTVKRLSGATRYDTDKAVVENGGAAGVGSINGTATAIVASGLKFPDALAGGALAYADKLPVIITDANTLSPQAKAALTDLGIGQVIIAGSTASVSAAVEKSINDAGVTTLFRASGVDRSDTSRLLANWEISNAGFVTTTFDVASGENSLSGVDALAGGPLAGSTKTPLLVTNGINAAGSVTAFAAANSATITGFTIFGDTPSVSAAVAAGLTATVQAPPATNSLQVSPSTTALMDIATDTTGDRQYTVSGLDNTKTYTVALLPTGDVSGTGSATTFADANSNNQADDLGGAAATSVAHITVVNGAVAASNGLDTTTPVNGIVTFTLRGVGVGSVTPIVFIDANSDSQLNLTVPATVNANAKSSTEVYGLGGATAWKDAAASLGAYTAANGHAVTPTTVDVSNKFIDNGTNSFVWDSNDVFQYQGVGITMAQFESLISKGDTLDINYNPTASGVSTFNITAATEAAPTIATAAAASNLDNGTTANDVTITVTPTATDPAGTTYQLLRASVATSTTASAGATFAAVAGATKTVNASGTITFTDSNVAAGNYYYEVQATYPVTGDTKASLASPASGSPVVITGASAGIVALSTAPVSLSSTVSDADSNGLVNSGDTITVTFNEPLGSVAAGAAVALKDADGTIGTLTNGTNATFTVGGTNNTVLTIKATGAPSLSAAGTTAGLAIPSTFQATGTSGVVDTTSQAWDLTGDGAGAAPMGIVTAPGSGTANKPAAPTAPTSTAGSSAITGAAGSAIAGATVTVVVTTGTGNAAADGTYTATAGSDGSWSVTAAANLAAGQNLSTTQTVGQGVGTSAATASVT